MVLPHPNTVRRIVDRAVHAVNKRRRTRERTVDVAKQVMTPKKREDLRTPEDVVVRRQLDGDKVSEVKRRRR